jgi:hypothetical protein
MARLPSTSFKLSVPGLAILCFLVSSSGFAQGCEPIRFTTPVNLGGAGSVYQPANEWQLTLAYRRLRSEDWFVGSNENPALAPGGQSPVFSIHTIVANVAYAFRDRYRAHISVPVSFGSLTRTWPDKEKHEQNANGIGDVSIMGEAWLLAPKTHETGNVSVGLGVKIPTGSHKIQDTYYGASGPVEFPADQTIQPGDGGWAMIAQVNAFRKFRERLAGYAFGSYMVSPKARSDVAFAPSSPTYWSVPDVYSARAGAAYSLLPDQGLTVSLGGRIDGIPVHDLMGGGDSDTIKRTSYVVFADPGLSLTRGSGTFTLTVPYRLRVNRQKSLLESRTDGLNAGGFAKYLVFASYMHRL